MPSTSFVNPDGYLIKAHPNQFSPDLVLVQLSFHSILFHPIQFSFNSAFIESIFYEIQFSSNSVFTKFSFYQIRFSPNSVFTCPPRLRWICSSYPPDQEGQDSPQGCHLRRGVWRKCITRFWIWFVRFWIAVKISTKAGASYMQPHNRLLKEAWCMTEKWTH